ncbi:MAG TPA: hypothetical protein PK413_07555 [Thermoanaerobaculia bacterium]|nr:hypothetical protein [Thermoanaerobaculia bacterium]
MSDQQKSKTWMWVAIGCGSLAVLAVISVVGLGFWGWRKAKNFEHELKDPQARAAKVRSVLGASELPSGYYPVIGMEVPFLMRMAMLSDREPPAGEREPRPKFDARGFLFVETINSGKSARKMEDFIQGRASLDELMQDGNFHFSVHDSEKVAEGPLTVSGGQARFVTQRGEVNMGGSNLDHSLASYVLVDCPGDRKMRLAIWFGPDPSPDVPKEQLSLAGTPGDPQALEAFLGHFKLCP